MPLRHESKIDPAPMIGAHFASFVESDGRRDARDYASQVGVPVAAGVVAWFGKAHISAGTGIATVTLSGIFAAFLFGLTIQLLDRAATWAESQPTLGARTSQYAKLLEELSANTGYASLVAGLAAALALIASLVPAGRAERALTCLAFIVLVHLGITILMVMRRTYLLTKAYLNKARTGA